MFFSGNTMLFVKEILFDLCMAVDIELQIVALEITNH